MVCESCGEKPKNTAKDFTKAVIEINNPEALVLLRKVVIPASMGDEESVPPAVGKYRNVLLQYEANGHIYLYSSDGIPTAITANIPQEVLDSIADLEDDVVDLQEQIDDLKNSPDVVDIVPTYAALQAYDTSRLGDNDIIRVLQDEQHDGQSTYYRWNASTQTWTYIGAVGDYYTKGQIDNLLDDKQDTLTAGANIQINNNVISATDTTYTHFTGATASTEGTQGLVPAPLAGDEDKFLKADGTWDTAGGGGPTVVQSTGTSTTSVMSQNAVTSAIFKDPSTQEIVKIGKNSTAGDIRNVSIGYYATAGTGGAAYSVAVGGQAYAPNQDAIALGSACNAQANGAVAIGKNATVYSSVTNGEAIGYFSKANSGHDYSVAIGAYASTTRAGEVNIGTGTNSYGYNSTSYRVLGGVHDPVDAHDAATKGYVDAATPVITMTTTDPGEGSALAANNYLAVYGGDPVVLDYATSEINTGTKWINGDTIYKKTVSVGNLPNATTATTAHNISNFATLVKLEGSFTNGTNSAPIPYASPTATKCVQAYADATNITIVTGEDRSAYSGYVTLYYTKSS